MENSYETTSQTTGNKKAIYVHDKEMGWINVTLFLEDLKHIIKSLENKKHERKDFNLNRLYYSSD
jgi:hypothetical protein